MPVMHSYYCPNCGEVAHDQWSDDVPVCCGHQMKIAFLKVNTTEWGSPRHIPTLRDEPFESRSELESWTKKNGMSLGTSAEKVGGARNEEYLNKGKLYSFSK
jgi:hypothetical protein